jgi:hypothetical protein
MIKEVDIKKKSNMLQIMELIRDTYKKETLYSLNDIFINKYILPNVINLEEPKGVNQDEKQEIKQA